MMTIKEFASLCGCNAQTLRYYDKIHLLKPVKVDPWSGYRYYTKQQAIDFVKIKNLQAADFTIGEIRDLLNLPDDLVYEAFDRKINAQQQKLERIREIQKTYLTEKHNMETMIKDLCGYLVSFMRNPDCMLEFGMDPENANAVKDQVRSYLENTLGKGVSDPKTTTIVIDEEVFQAHENPKFVFTLDEENLPDELFLGDENIAQDGSFDPGNYDSVWECHGWEHVYEFLDEIPPMEPGVDYCFWFHLKTKDSQNDLSFPLFLLGAMLQRGYGSETSMSCSVDPSEDGRNHFTLLRRK